MFFIFVVLVQTKISKILEKWHQSICLQLSDAHYSPFQFAQRKYNSTNTAQSVAYDCQYIVQTCRSQEFLMPLQESSLNRPDMKMYSQFESFCSGFLLCSHHLLVFDYVKQCSMASAVLFSSMAHHKTNKLLELKITSSDIQSPWHLMIFSMCF